MSPSTTPLRLWMTETQTHSALPSHRFRRELDFAERNMASSASIPSASAAVANLSTAASSGRHSRVSFQLLILHSNSSMPHFALPKAHLKQRIFVNRCPEVRTRPVRAVGSYSNDGAASESKYEVFAAKDKETESVEEALPFIPMSEEEISEFLIQVASLVKLVDSKDVTELQLKKLDCELIIRKKEALPQTLTSAPIVMMHQPPHPAPMPPQYLQPPHAPDTSSAVVASSSPSPPPAPKPANSLHPFLKSPMAGTFYKSSGPGMQPYVKVGDHVKKGQVLCIVEAMKLMNEIEADQSGKVADILVEDGKAVSIDQPLFVIEP